METLNLVLDVLSNIFIIYLILYCVILFAGVAIGIVYLNRYRLEKKYRNEIKRDFYLPVSILLPAFNEGVIILKSVSSLLQLDYKNYELVIIDDGSSDNTCKLLIDKYKLKKVEKIPSANIKTKNVIGYYCGKFNGVDITLVMKENGKKADTINAGINVCKYSYFITIDADTILPRNSLEQIVRPVIISSKTVAVGGCVKLVNNYNIKNDQLVEKKSIPSFLIGVQEIMYDRAFLSSKFLFDSFNGNLIISGAYGLFKKDIVIKCNGYNSDTIGEDMDLVLKIHKYCLDNKIDYDIKYVESARCYTQAPDTLKAFTLQQRRWYTGLIQCLFNYKTMFRPKYGKVGMFSLSYMLIFEFLAPIIETIGLIVLLLLFIVNSDLISNIEMLIAYIGFCSLVSIVSFLLRIYNENFKGMSFKIIISMICFCFLENLGFRQLMNFKRLGVLFNYKKYSHSWIPIPRKEI